MKVFASIITLVLFLSCQSDFIQQQDEVIAPLYSNVDSRLWVYFQKFEDEAASRGHFIDLNELEITGVISNIPEDGVVGTCQYGSHISHVTIDNNYWSNSVGLQREFVVFHELGHCVLDRGHTEASFSNGICKSIMQSGLGDCNVAYNSQNRTYYLDELFQGFRP